MYLFIYNINLNCLLQRQRLEGFLAKECWDSSVSKFLIKYNGYTKRRISTTSNYCFAPSQVSLYLFL